MLCYAKSLQSCPTLCDPIDGIVCYILNTYSPGREVQEGGDIHVPVADSC